MTVALWLLLSLAVSSAQEPKQEPPGLTLRMCHCGVGQQWDGEECVAAEKTYIPIWDPLTNEAYLINSTDFTQVRTEPITCHDFNEPTVLKGGVLLETTGLLYWSDQQRQFREYCADFMPQFTVKVCLPAPQIPRCCPPEHVLEKDFSCTRFLGTNFTPPVYVQLGGEPQRFPDTNAVDAIEEVRCEGFAVPYRVDLSSGSNALVYNAQKASLYWQQPSLHIVVSDKKNSYCIGIEKDASYGEQKYVGKVCYTDPAKEHRHTCANATCVRKCCSEEEVFTPNGCVLIPGKTWHPSIHLNNNLTIGEEIPENLVVITGFPICENYFPLKPDNKDDEYYTLMNGTLHMPLQESHAADRYCLDLMLTINGTEKLAMVCGPEEKKECEWKNVLVVVLLCISCLFLFATLVVYISVAELRERTNGRCLISMVAAMLATYVSLVTNREIRDGSDAYCYSIGFVSHVCTLATFFWLNVMCFDMWSTLRSSKRKYQSLKMFVFYSIYAWGCPSLIGIVGLALDLAETPNLIRPKFITNSLCWFRDNEEFWTYVSGIILVLLVINLFFFVHVAVTLVRKLKQSQAALDNNESRASNANKRNKEQIWLFVRLFIVMGVVWTAEILSTLHRGTCDYWVLTDMLNSLQGVFIFGVAVCNKDNIKKIKTAWKKRMWNIQTRMSTMRGGADQFSRVNQAKRFTNLSVAASESSRKTSVTSLPRKISTASSAFNPNSNNKNSRLIEQSPETSKKATSPSADRKISTASHLEMIPMSDMAE